MLLANTGRKQMNRLETGYIDIGQYPPVLTITGEFFVKFSLVLSESPWPA